MKRFFAAILIVVLARAPFMHIPFFSGDEAVTAAISSTMMKGGLIYHDAIDHRGPLTPFFYTFIFHLAGDGNMTAVHFSLLLLLLGCILVIYRIGSMFGRDTGLWAGLVFAISSSIHPATDFQAFHTEWSAIFFEMIAVLLFFYKGIEKKKGPFLFFSGILFSLAFFSKQVALADYGVALLFCIALDFRERQGRFWFPGTVQMASGFFLTALFFGAFFFLQGAFSDFWFYFYEYNRRYYVPGILLSEKIHEAINILSFRSGYLRNENFLLVLAFLIFGSRVAGDFFSGRWKNAQKFWAHAFLLGWGVSALGAALYSGRVYAHYLIMALPAFSLAAARVLDGCSRQFRTLLMGYPKEKTFVKTGFAVIFLMASGIFFFQWNIPFALDRFGQYYSRAGTPQDIREAAEYIKSGSSADKKIFIWGWCPQLYLLSHRASASRFVYCNFLSGLIPGNRMDMQKDTAGSIIPGSWEILRTEMEKNKPAFIVDASVGNHEGYGKYPIDKFPVLFHLIQADYVADRDIFHPNGSLSFRIYKRKDLLIHA